MQRLGNLDKQEQSTSNYNQGTTKRQLPQPISDKKRVCRRQPFTAAPKTDEYGVKLVRQQPKAKVQHTYQTKRGKWLAFVFGELDTDVLEYDHLRQAVKDGNQSMIQELKAAGEKMEKRLILTLRTMQFRTMRSDSSKEMETKRKVAEQLLALWK